MNIRLTSNICCFGHLLQDSPLSQSMTLPQLNTLHNLSPPLKLKDDDSFDKGTKSLWQLNGAVTTVCLSEFLAHLTELIISAVKGCLCVSKLLTRVAPVCVCLSC